jgi:SNF2 family DNA or RNA helicase
VLDAAVDKIMDSRPEPWVVFTEFKPTVNCLVERLNKLSTKAKPIRAEAYHGDVDPERRRELGRLFQAGEIDVLVGTMKSMREGITLTAGFNQFWVSRDWVPDNNEQGEDRQDRIGQTRQVLVWIAQPADTVAVSKIEPTNRVKERIVRTILPKDEIEEG